MNLFACNLNNQALVIITVTTNRPMQIMQICRSHAYKSPPCIQIRSIKNLLLQRERWLLETSGFSFSQLSPNT